MREAWLTYVYQYGIAASEPPGAPASDAGWTEGDPVALAPTDLARIGAVSGDLLFVSHPSRWHGGLRGTHVRAATAADDTHAGQVRLPQDLLRRIKVAPGQRIRVERIL